MPNTLPDFKCRALESRRAQLLEEYEAITNQQGHTLNAADALKLRRQAEALEAEIAEIEAQLEGWGVSQTVVQANPSISDMNKPPFFRRVINLNKPVGLFIVLALLIAVLLGNRTLFHMLLPSATPAVTNNNTITTRTPTLIPTWAPTPTPRPLALGDTHIRETDGIVMIYVPAGKFQMGSTEAEIQAAVETCMSTGSTHETCETWIGREMPAHMVTLDAFWMDRTEITNAQYEQCVVAEVCDVSAHKSDNRYNGAMQPVVGISWHDAEAYCAWVGGRLPTEAEWEYAARGPESLTYPWGNEWQPGLANCWEVDCQDGYEYTAPVGSFPAGASWVGALDMAGNVREWVMDWYGNYPSEQQVNPTGPTSGEYRVLRGGSWANPLAFNRCSYRVGYDPGFRYNNRGFRCVQTSSQTP